MKNTIIKIKIQENNTTFKLQNLIGCTKINWGDSNITTDIQENELYEHTYNLSGEYTIELENLTSIGSDFFGNGGTEQYSFDIDVVCGDIVKSIQPWAFSIVNTLNSIILNEGIESIGAGAFEGANITELNIPGTIKVLSSLSIYGLAKLKKVIFNTGTTIIESQALTGNVELEEIIFPDSLKEIGAYAFSQTKLEKVILPEGLEQIGDYAFSETYNIKIFFIPSSVKYIGEKILYIEDDGRPYYDGIGMSKYFSTNIYVNFESQPKDWDINWNYQKVRDGGGSFNYDYYNVNWNVIKVEDFNGYYYYIKDNELYLISDNNLSTESVIYEIPSYINGYPVVGLENFFLFGVDIETSEPLYNNLQTIIWPNSLKYIGSFCVYGFSEVKEILVRYENNSTSKENCLTLPDNLKNIGLYSIIAFPKIISLYIPEKVQNLSCLLGLVILGIDDITKIEILGTIDRANYLLQECPFLEKEEIWDENGFLYIDNILLSDKERVYHNRLEKYKITDGTKIINRISYTNFNTLIIPGNINTIDQGFDGTTITDLVFNGTVNNMYYRSFANGSNIPQGTNVYINNLEDWLNINFDDAECNPLCRKGKFFIKKEGIIETDFDSNNYDEITELVIPDNTIIKKYAFANFKNLTKVTFGKNVIINESAFYKCPSLNEIIGFENCTYIGKDAFYGCSNLNINLILQNCTYIGDNAFYGCTNITQLTLNNIEYIGSSAFEGTNLNLVNITNLDKWQKTIKGNDKTFPNQYQLFLNDEEITDLLISEPLPDYVFYNCSSILNVQINTNIISNYMFYNCINLNTISLLTDTLSSVGQNAFYNTSFFNNDENWITIGKEGNSGKFLLFEYNSNKFLIASKDLKGNQLLLEHNIKLIADNAFENSNISQVIFNGELECIGKNSFKNSTIQRLTFIIMNSTLKLKKISDYAFYNCTNLDTIASFNGNTEEETEYVNAFNTFNDLTYIGNYAFYKTSLSNIYIPINVTFIGSQCFVSAKTSITPEITTNYDMKPGTWRVTWNGLYSVVIWGVYAIIHDFVNYYEYYIKNNQIYLTSYFGSDSTHIVPTYITYKDVTYLVVGIGTHTYSTEQYLVYNLSTLYINDNIKTVEANIFYNVNDNLTVYCSPSSKPVDWSSEWNYDNHKDKNRYVPVKWNTGNIIENENYLYSIQNNKGSIIKFLNKKSYSDLKNDFDDCVITKILENAYDSSNIKLLYIPKTVVSIENNFNNCNSLTIYTEYDDNECNLNWNNKKVYYKTKWHYDDKYIYALFKDYAGIIEFLIDSDTEIIPENIENIPITFIGERAFRNKEINEIILSDKITDLKEESLHSTRLYNITLNDNINHIGKNCFYINYLNPVLLYQKDDFICIKNINNEKSLYLIKINNIEHNNNMNIDVITIMDGLYDNYNYANNLIISGKVNNLGNNFNHYGRSLLDLSNMPIIPTIGENSFNDVSSSFKVKINKIKINEILNVPHWKKYKDLISYTLSPIEKTSLNEYGIPEIIKYSENNSKLIFYISNIGNMFNYINLSLQSNNKDSSNTDNFYIKINDEYIFSYILNNVDSNKNIEILGEYGFILINNKPIELDEIYKNGTYMQNQIKMQSYSPLLIEQNYLEIINNELWVDKTIVDNYISKINNFKIILSITKRINSELLSNYNNNLYGKNNFNLQFLSYTFLVDINSYDSGRNKYKCILLEDTNFNSEFCNNSNIYLTGYNEIEINKNGILNWYIEVLKTNNL